MLYLSSALWPVVSNCCSAYQWFASFRLEAKFTLAFRQLLMCFWSVRKFVWYKVRQLSAWEFVMHRYCSRFRRVICRAQNAFLQDGPTPRSWARLVSRGTIKWELGRVGAAWMSSFIGSGEVFLTLMFVTVKRKDANRKFYPHTNYNLCELTAFSMLNI